MTASIIDGKLVAAKIRSDIKQIISTRTLQGLRPPGLAVILIGDDPASSIYVKTKRLVCAEVGINSYAYDLPSNTNETELIALIDSLNDNEKVNGILVQLPLPAHINSTTILERINPKKDVDGFHPYNFGRLAQGSPLLRPCTPYGVMQLLQYYKLDVLGKHTVVVGASNIVGRPMALELLLAKATVTICHSATQRLEQHIRTADLVVVGAGAYNVVKTDWLHKEQIIIDIGMHRRQDGTIHGDVDFNEARSKVKWITPVPGGVGPMTICTLLQNTLLAAGIGEEA
jgi:methylenetetrahydrofolate dehydrogenase (NADP+)/methenyltetrahydrofolate cyclohydrolase